MNKHNILSFENIRKKLKPPEEEDLEELDFTHKPAVVHHHKPRRFEFLYYLSGYSTARFFTIWKIVRTKTFQYALSILIIMASIVILKFRKNIFERNYLLQNVDENAFLLNLHINGSFTNVPNDNTTIVVEQLKVEWCDNNRKNMKFSLRCGCVIKLRSVNGNILFAEGNSLVFFGDDLDGFWKRLSVTLNENDISNDRKSVYKQFVIENNEVTRHNIFRSMNFANSIKLNRYNEDEENPPFFEKNYVLSHGFFYIPETFFFVVFKNLFRMEAVEFQLPSLLIKTSGPSGHGKSLSLFYQCKLFHGPHLSTHNCGFVGGDTGDHRTQRLESAFHGNFLNVFDQPGDFSEKRVGENMFFSNITQRLLISRCQKNINLKNINTFTEDDLLNCDYKINDLINKKISKRKKWIKYVNQKFDAQMTVMSIGWLENKKNEDFINEYKKLNLVLEKHNIFTRYILLYHLVDEEPDTPKVYEKNRKLFGKIDSIYIFKTCTEEKYLDCGIIKDRIKRIKCMKCFSDNYKNLGDALYDSVSDGIIGIKRFHEGTKFEGSVYNWVFYIFNTIGIVLKEVGFLPKNEEGGEL